MTVQVRTTPQADAQIREIDDWWRANRTASPDLFVNELAAAFEILASAPMIGRLYRKSPVANTRRLLLKESRYHLYYLASPNEVRVLSVWHAQRGKGPRLSK